MNQPTHADLLEFALRTAKAAGEAILPHFRVALDVADKGGGKGYDPVTVADHAAETVIRSAIARAYPDHGIHGEEHGREQGTSKYTWVIDPIDGTRSFILGQMHWATLIALNDGDARRGRRRAPAVRRRVVRRHRRRHSRMAARRRAAHAEDAPLPERWPTRSSPAPIPKMFRLPPRERAAFDRVADRARLTRWGGDCYAYCLLAMGLIDVVIESALHAYDVQALMPIVERGRRRDDHVGRRARGRRRPDRRLRRPGAAREVLHLLAPGLADAGRPHRPGIGPTRRRALPSRGVQWPPRIGAVLPPAGMAPSCNISPCSRDQVYKCSLRSDSRCCANSPMGSSTRARTSPRRWG